MRGAQQHQVVWAREDEAHDDDLSAAHLASPSRCLALASRERLLGGNVHCLRALQRAGHRTLRSSLSDSAWTLEIYDLLMLGIRAQTCKRKFAVPGSAQS